MRALYATDGPVWHGGLHAADTRAKMFVSLLASVVTVYCRLEGDRVILAGRAVLYARSELMLEDRP